MQERPAVVALFPEEVRRKEVSIARSPNIGRSDLRYRGSLCLCAEDEPSAEMYSSSSCLVPLLTKWQLVSSTVLHHPNKRIKLPILRFRSASNFGGMTVRRIPPIQIFRQVSESFTRTAFLIDRS